MITAKQFYLKTRSKIQTNWCRTVVAVALTVVAHVVAHHDVNVFVVAVVVGVIINILETTGKCVHNLSQYLHILPSFDL